MTFTVGIDLAEPDAAVGCACRSRANAVSPSRCRPHNTVAREASHRIAKSLRPVREPMGAWDIRLRRLKESATHSALTSSVPAHTLVDARWCPVKIVCVGAGHHLASTNV